MRNLNTNASLLRNKNFRVFVGKFTKTVDISYNIENFKAKVSNVHDGKHVGIEMSTSRGHAPMPHGKHEQIIDLFW